MYKVKVEIGVMADSAGEAIERVSDELDFLLSLDNPLAYSVTGEAAIDLDSWKNQTVINGTHRPQDLVPAFMEVLKELDPVAYSAHAVALFPLPPAYVADEGDDSEWWNSEECSHFLNECLFNELNACAPDGFYFGAHPGNGSDFGFWEVEEE